jgi:two-component system response regulator
MRNVIEVLIVDASNDDAKLTLDSLRNVAAGTSVLRLIDGEEALHFICATDGYARRPAGLPKLVLLDLHMPRMDAIALLHSVRQMPDMHEMPVVLWTRADNSLFVEQAMQAGASAYHVKPATREAYRAEIEAIVRRWLQRDGLDVNATSSVNAS